MQKFFVRSFEELSYVVHSTKALYDAGEFRWKEYDNTFGFVRHKYQGLDDELISE